MSGKYGACRRDLATAGVEPIVRGNLCDHCPAVRDCRTRVAAYLRAQAGVVTNIESHGSDFSYRPLGSDEVLVTFSLRMLEERARLKNRA